MRDFEHILLTRFNAYFVDRGFPRDEWLRYRLELFGRYTLPSIAGQTVLPDRWIVFSHVQSPDWFKRDLATALSTLPICDLAFMTGPWDARQLAELTGERMRRNVPRLLTTHLDCDDAVSRDFIEIVQANCPALPWGFLNLTHGAQLRDGKVYFRSDPANPFMSLVETPGAAVPRTTFLDWHNRLPSYGPVRQVHTHPTWLQIVHGMNLQNTIRGIRADPDAIARHFDIDLGLQPIGSLALLADMMVSSLRLAFRIVQRPHRILWAIRVLMPGHRTIERRSP